MSYGDVDRYIETLRTGEKLEVSVSSLASPLRTSLSCLSCASPLPRTLVCGCTRLDLDSEGCTRAVLHRLVPELHMDYVTVSRPATQWLDVDSEDDTRTILHSLALWPRAACGLRVTVSQPATRWSAHKFPRAAGLRKTIHCLAMAWHCLTVAAHCLVTAGSWLVIAWSRLATVSHGWACGRPQTVVVATAGSNCSQSVTDSHSWSRLGSWLAIAWSRLATVSHGLP